jgi:hypothetical protein
MIHGIFSSFEFCIWFIFALNFRVSKALQANGRHCVWIINVDDLKDCSSGMTFLNLCWITATDVLQDVLCWYDRVQTLEAASVFTAWSNELGLLPLSLFPPFFVCQNYARSRYIAFRVMNLYWHSNAKQYHTNLFITELINSTGISEHTFIIV